MFKIVFFKCAFVGILVLIAAEVIAQNDPFAEEKYKGKVLSVTEFYEEKATGSGKNLEMQLDYFFNEAGQIIREVKGEFGFNYLYDKLGNQILLTLFQGIDSIGFTTYKYNNKNELIEEKNSSGEYSLYTYNSDGNITSIVSYDKKGILTTRGNYSYNEEDGFCTEERWYTASGFSERLTNLHQYHHDDLGNTTNRFHEIYDIYFHGEGYNIATEYDSLNRWTQFLKTSDDNKFIWRETATYDEMGNQTGTISYDQVGEIIETTTHIFKYDLVGNWIEKKTFINEKLTVTRKREIQYFLE